MPTKPAAALARARIEATKAIGTIWSSPHERTRDVGAAPAKAALGAGEVPGGCAKRIQWGKSGGGNLDGHTSIVQYPLAFLGRWPRVWWQFPVTRGGVLQSRAEARPQRSRRGWTWMHGTQRSRLIR
jgi:hypothetical protein